MTDEVIAGIANGEYSIHDSFMREIRIDYIAKKIIFIVEIPQEDGKKVKVQLIDITMISGDMNFDCKNREIILHFDINNQNEVELYTSSNTLLKIIFRTIVVNWI